MPGRMASSVFLPVRAVFGGSSAGWAMTTPIVKLPDNTKLVYANWVRLNANVLDLGIDFGYVEEAFMGPPEDGFPVRVVMSWEQAKGLMELLQENVSLYEQHAGKIRDFEGEEEDDDDEATRPAD